MGSWGSDSRLVTRDLLCSVGDRRKRGKHYKEKYAKSSGVKSVFWPQLLSKREKLVLNIYISALDCEEKWIKRTLKSVTQEISNKQIWSWIFCRLWTKQKAAIPGDRNWVKSTKIGPGGWTMTSWMGTKIKTIAVRVTFPQWRPLLSRYPRARKWPGALNWPMSRQSAPSSLHLRA